MDLFRKTIICSLAYLFKAMKSMYFLWAWLSQLSLLACWIPFTPSSLKMWISRPRSQSQPKVCLRNGDQEKGFDINVPATEKLGRDKEAYVPLLLYRFFSVFFSDPQVMGKWKCQIKYKGNYACCQLYNYVDILEHRGFVSPPNLSSLLRRGLFRAALTESVSYLGRGKKWQRAGNAGKGKESREASRPPALSLFPSFPRRPPKPNITLIL